MKPNLTDEELIRQYLHNSPNACFEVLYTRYVGKIYKRCFSLTKDSEKAQDFTHDIFIRMFNRLDRFQERSSFSTWLHAISHNYCLDQIRLAKRLPTTSLKDETDEYGYTSDEGDPVEHSLQNLSLAMKRISPQEAALLKLKYQDGMPIQQIAAQLNLKDSTVKMRLKRSRTKVRQLYGAVAY